MLAIESDVENVCAKSWRFDVEHQHGSMPSLEQSSALIECALSDVGETQRPAAGGESGRAGLDLGCDEPAFDGVVVLGDRIIPHLVSTRKHKDDVRVPAA